jgi:transposase
LVDDKHRPAKQRHTAKRKFERLRAEHEYTGGYTIMKDYVRQSRIGGQEMFVPLSHAPGDAQADFGEAMAVIARVECKAHFMAFDLPHSDDCFVQAFPAETTEAFPEGDVRAFEYFGVVPSCIVCDNTTLAVARILGDGERQKTAPSLSCTVITCSRRSSALRPRATIRASSRTWLAMRGATSWFRFRRRQATDSRII